MSQALSFGESPRVDLGEDVIVLAGWEEEDS